MPISTSVIVVNYRTPAALQRFVDSYVETAPEDAELIVVDVDPEIPFGLKEIPGDYIIQYENSGYATACNTASVEASGEVLAFFNADVVLCKDTIAACSRALLENVDWGVVGPLQYSSAGHVTHAGIFGTLEAPRHRAWQQPVSNEFRDVEPAVTVSGSALFVKRACWQDLTNCPIWRDMYPDVLGAFLPTFLFWEETFLCYHAQAHGWQVIYYGLAECVHEWHD